jgi:hypothetical protein
MQLHGRTARERNKVPASRGGIESMEFESPPDGGALSDYYTERNRQIEVLKNSLRQNFTCPSFENNTFSHAKKEHGHCTAPTQATQVTPQVPKPVKQVKAAVNERAAEVIHPNRQETFEEKKDDEHPAQIQMEHDYFSDSTYAEDNEEYSDCEFENAEGEVVTGKIDLDLPRLYSVVVHVANAVPRLGPKKRD